MRPTVKSIAACITILALVLWISPVAMANDAAGRLEGLVVGVDGRPASGYTVHLIDESGEDHAQSTADDQGLYSFRDLPPGDYAMGIENTEGQIAPVATPPVRLGEGELARRDVKMMNAESSTRNEVAGADLGFGMWWSSLSTAAKVWIVIGAVAGAAFIVNELDDDEPASSEFE